MNNLVIIELFKLRNRWLPYILLCLILFYLLYLAQMSYFGYRNLADDISSRVPVTSVTQNQTQVTITEVTVNSGNSGGVYIDYYTNDLVLPNSLNRYFDAVLGLGPLLAIILGGLSVGNEYGWGTIKQTLVEGISRTGFLWSKIFSLGLVVLIGMAITTIAAFVISLVTTRLVVGYIDWGFLSLSFVGHILAQVGSVFVSVLIYLVLSIFLGIVLRSAPAGMALGFGFFYIEAIIMFQGANATGWLKDILELSINYNIKQLSLCINPSSIQESSMQELARPLWQSFSILAGYGMTFIAGAFSILNKQDLTH